MKTFINVLRIAAGILFIFSGLVKAIDPRGLAYKMEEFFQVWSAGGFMPRFMSVLETYQLPVAIAMITLEVLVGVALLIGYRKKAAALLLFLLMIFFTFLTAFVLFTGKIKACGCFGDCIPLTPQQTFTKDIILLIISILLLIGLKHFPAIKRSRRAGLIMVIALLFTLGLQWWVLHRLPLIDCLPYKKGNDIAALRKVPADAVPDVFDYIFVYEKAGKKQEFKMDATPDSTWTFVDRKQVLVKQGKNNIPLINDFSLTTEAGNDSTDDILAQDGEYYLLFMKNTNGLDEKAEDREELKKLIGNGEKVYVVTSQLAQVKQRFGSVPGIIYLTCDATVLKTVARVNPTLYKMKGPVVQDKRVL